MDGTAFSASLEGPIRAMQVITGAMVMGVVFFLGIAVFIVNQSTPPVVPPNMVGGAGGAGGIPLFTLVGVIAAASALTTRGFLLQILLVLERKRLAGELAQTAGDAQRPPEHVAAATMNALLGVLRKRLIVGAALVEGATFLNGVVYILDRSPISLGVAGVLTIVLASHFPTRSYVEKWIAGQYELLSSENLIGNAH